MRVIALTGGIAMGKSTVARLFHRHAIPVFDADREVHRLQAPGGAALPAIAAAFPGTVIGHRLDRAALRQAVLGNAAALRRLEDILHPLVRVATLRFIARHRRARRRAVLLDIPLLFEAGAAIRPDLILVVSAPAALQRQRLARRGTLSAAQIAAILARQWPDAARRARADHVIKTGLSRRHAQARLARLLKDLP